MSLMVCFSEPSPESKKESEELELAKECEAMIERGLARLARHRRKKQERMRVVPEAAEFFMFKMDRPGT
jgi:hypothetical protein